MQVLDLVLWVKVHAGKEGIHVVGMEDKVHLEGMEEVNLILVVWLNAMS